MAHRQPHAGAVARRSVASRPSHRGRLFPDDASDHHASDKGVLGPGGRDHGVRLLNGYDSRASNYGGYAAEARGTPNRYADDVGGAPDRRYGEGAERGGVSSGGLRRGASQDYGGRAGSGESRIGLGGSAYLGGGVVASAGSRGENGGNIQAESISSKTPAPPVRTTSINGINIPSERRNFGRGVASWGGEEAPHTRPRRVVEHTSRVGHSSSDDSDGRSPPPRGSRGSSGGGGLLDDVVSSLGELVQTGLQGITGAQGWAGGHHRVVSSSSSSSSSDEDSEVMFEPLFMYVAYQGTKGIVVWDSISHVMTLRRRST